MVLSRKLSFLIMKKNYLFRGKMIRIIFKNQVALNFECSATEFEKIMNNMRSLTRFIKCSETVWVRKSEIVTIEYNILPKEEICIPAIG